MGRRRKIEDYRGRLWFWQQPFPAADFGQRAGAVFDCLFRSGTDPVWIESGAGENRGLTIMSAGPFARLRWRAGRGSLTFLGAESRAAGKEKRTWSGDPFALLESLWSEWKLPSLDNPAFTAGALGCFSYDLGRAWEELPEETEDDLGLPEQMISLYGGALVYDHRRERLWLTATGLPLDPSSRRQAAAQERLKRWSRKVAVVLEAEESPLEAVTERAAAALRSTYNRATYCRAVERVKEYIAAGDVFQVNLSQRLAVPFGDGGFELFRRLRRISPEPYAAYLRFPETELVSASPELFLRLRGDRVLTAPIKGTRPRGEDPEEDAALRQELLVSEKDRAELLMITDLERNDLGRVCRHGSVRVRELFALEEHPQVFHLVSKITGRLDSGRSGFDLLRSAFPGGSITGAPKIRAMEIIEELEPVRRGPYTGSIGWLSLSGDMELNIAIRTVILCRGTAYVSVGGGIVADSVPAAEYEETLDKAAGMLTALGIERGSVESIMERESVSRAKSDADGGTG